MFNGAFLPGPFESLFANALWSRVANHLALCISVTGRTVVLVTRFTIANKPIFAATLSSISIAESIFGAFSAGIFFAGNSISDKTFFAFAHFTTSITFNIFANSIFVASEANVLFAASSWDSFISFHTLTSHFPDVFAHAFCAFALTGSTWVFQVALIIRVSDKARLTVTFVIATESKLGAAFETVIRFTSGFRVTHKSFVANTSIIR